MTAKEVIDDLLKKMSNGEKISVADLGKIVDTISVKDYVAGKNAVTVLTAVLDDPAGYGRIIKDNWGKFVKIVEQKDASLEEQRVDEINSGMYIFDSAVLNRALSKLNNDNAQGEYYLTDTIEIIKSERLGEVATVIVEDADEIKRILQKRGKI